MQTATIPLLLSTRWIEKHESSTLAESVEELSKKVKHIATNQEFGKTARTAIRPVWIAFPSAMLSFALSSSVKFGKTCMNLFWFMMDNYLKKNAVPYPDSA